MREIVARHVATARRLPSIVQNQHASARARLFLRETQIGTRNVREECNRGGRLLFTQAAALKFIRSEFGAGAQIIAADVVQKKAA